MSNKELFYLYWTDSNCKTEPRNTYTLVARWLVCTEGWLHRWQGWRWSTQLCLASMAMFSAACQSLTVCGHISLQEQLQDWLRVWLSVLWSLSNQREFLLNMAVNLLNLALLFYKHFWIVSLFFKREYSLLNEVIFINRKHFCLHHALTRVPCSPPPFVWRVSSAH